MDYEHVNFYLKYFYELDVPKDILIEIRLFSSLGFNGENLLHYAALMPVRASCEYAIKLNFNFKKHDIDSREETRGLTPFLVAAKGGRVENMLLFASSGCDVFVESWSGMNALHYAAKQKNIKMWEYLIELGLNKQNKDAFGMAPLDYWADAPDEVISMCSSLAIAGQGSRLLLELFE